MRPIREFAPALAVAAALVTALPVPSQARDQAEKPASSAPEPGDPEARRQMLNARQAQAARQQVEANRASQAHHEAAVALNGMAQERNDALYSDALTANAQARQQYRETRKQWERTNPYCWNGDATKCPADPVPPPSGS